MPAEPMPAGPIVAGSAAGAPTGVSARRGSGAPQGERLRERLAFWAYRAGETAIKIGRAHV